MNEREYVFLDLYPCGCSIHQRFEIIKRSIKKGRTAFILKCSNCNMNTGFQPTIERASKVWNECLTANCQEAQDSFENIETPLFNG